MRFEQFSSQFSSHFSQVEGAKDEIVCWDLYSLEVLTKLDLTTALPGAGAFLDPERNMERAEHCWTQHLFYHGFIWIIIYTETLGWNWWKTQSKHLYKINLANGLAAEQEQEAMHDERTFTGQPLVTATEDGRKREMKVVHLDNMDFWVHRSLYQSQRSIWLFLKVWIYNSV